MTAIDRSPSLSPWDTTSNATTVTTATTATNTTSAATTTTTTPTTKVAPKSSFQTILSHPLRMSTNSPPSTPHTCMSTDLRSTSTVTDASPSTTSTSTSTAPSIATSPPSTPRASDATNARNPAHASKPIHMLFSNTPITENVTPPSSVNAIDKSQPQRQQQHPHHNHHPRTLPRCAVVNFHKDGDNLNWKPRVAQNLSGLPARAHNFEDAFSLEEFSSTTLPVVWTATGGNPRLSITDIASDDQLDPRRHLNCHHQSSTSRSEHSTAALSNDPPVSLPVLTKPAERSQHLQQPCLNQLTERPDRPRQQEHPNQLSPSQRQMSFSANLASTKSITLANEMRRPSFWSFLTHSRNYQYNRVRARVQTADGLDGRREFASYPGFRKHKQDSQRQQSLAHSHDKDLPSDHDSSTRMSLLRKLVSKFERRSTSNLAVSTAMPQLNNQDTPELETSALKDSSDSSNVNHPDRNVPSQNASRPTSNHLKFNGGNRDRPARMHSKWSSVETGSKKLSLFSNRRSKSNLAPIIPPNIDEHDTVVRKNSHKIENSNRAKVVVPDDQYLRFMTAVK